jgi:hypothetical protein
MLAMDEHRYTDAETAFKKAIEVSVRAETKINTKINLGICIASTQPFQAALGAESRVLPG